MNFTYNLYPLSSLEELQNRISGSNQKGVMFVYSTNDKDHLDFLTKIISSINFDRTDVVCMELYQNESIKIPSNFKGNPLELVLVFGLSGKNVCINTSHEKYSVLNFDGQKVLFVDSLSEISNIKELKRNLWLNLKELFGV